MHQNQSPSVVLAWLKLNPPALIAVAISQRDFRGTGVSIKRTHYWLFKVVVQAAEKTFLDEAIAPDHMVSIREKDRDTPEFRQPQSRRRQ